MGKAELFLPVRNEMGETPIWVPEESALYWVDVEGEAIFRWDRKTSSYGFRSIEVPVRALARRASGGWIGVTKKGLYFWDSDGDRFQLIERTSIENPDICYNDGVVDRQGRFLVNTFNQKVLDAPDGSLYRMDGDGSLHELDGGLALANGMGLSPDGNTLYVAEMFKNRLLAYDYDTACGTVSGRRVFAEVPKEEGMPDGLTVDAEGGVWCAHWGGFRVTRYDPGDPSSDGGDASGHNPQGSPQGGGHRGRRDKVFELPCAIVTCVGFGGEELDELFITTAWYSLDDAAKEAQPSAGDLFRAKPGVRGLPEPGFIG